MRVIYSPNASMESRAEFQSPQIISRLHCSVLPNNRSGLDKEKTIEKSIPRSQIDLKRCYDELSSLCAHFRWGIRQGSAAT